jgi:hypothetical protein
MKKLVFGIVAMAIGVIAFAAGANNLKRDSLSATGSFDGQYVYLSSYNYSDGYGYTSVYGYIPDVFQCWVETSNLDVTGSAKFGTVSFNTADMTCYYDTPAFDISAECVANGLYSSHGTNNDTTTYYDGVTYKNHWNYKSNSADCTISVDGVVFDDGTDDGAISTQFSVNK